MFAESSSLAWFYEETFRWGRLHGIDAPESRQLCATAEGQRWRCRQQAALSLADRIRRQQVSRTGRDIDRYGRFIAVCHHDGTLPRRPSGFAHSQRQITAQQTLLLPHLQSNRTASGLRPCSAEPQKRVVDIPGCRTPC